MDLVVCAMDLVVWWLWRGHAIGGVAMDLGGVAMNVPVGHEFGGVRGLVYRYTGDTTWCQVYSRLYRWYTGVYR